MPSPDNRPRVALERGLRVLSLLTLAVAIWIAVRPPVQRVPETAASAALDEALSRWTVAPPPRIHLALNAAPSRETRDWLRAIRRGGTPVSWAGDDIPAFALEVAPFADPRGGTILWIAAPTGARVAVHDAIAAIDTVIATAGGARILAPMTMGSLTATIGEHRTRARAPDTLMPRRVLILGRASWEAKFVIAALEEVGWGVDARLTVAPGVEVTQGQTRVPDTSRHAAVIVLEAPSASTASTVARYVRAGGGALLSGAGAQASGLGDIGVGRVGARVRASSIAFTDDAPHQALAFLAVAPRADAIVLDERAGRVAAAARRLEMGRVVQLGYDETWRWRLAGGAGAVAAHRDWWSALVSSVAHRAAVPLAREEGDDDAPLARLVDALGPSTADTAEMSTRARWSPSAALLFALISAFLLAELASRRLRGAP